MKDLLKSYKVTRRQLKKFKQNEQSFTIRLYLSESIRDVEYIIDWIESGRQPVAARGMERRSKRQREVLVDPFKMQSYVRPGTGGCRVHVSEEEQSLIDQYLSVLSECERECFLMVYGGGLTHAKAAELLRMSRGNVSTLLSRAQQKIELFQMMTAILMMAVFFLCLWGKSHLLIRAKNLIQRYCVRL